MIPREVRVGAMADYIIGRMKLTAIAEKWGVSTNALSKWAGAHRDVFKPRKARRTRGK